MAITPVGGATVDQSNPNAVVLPNAFGASTASTQFGTPPVSQVTDASAIQKAQVSDQSIQFPQQNTSAPQSIGDNTAIQSPIPTAASIIDQGIQTTPAEAKQKSILDRIAGLIGGGKAQQTMTNEAEAQAGVPELTKTVNGLTTQLQGLNDQATALANEAQYTIPNAIQVDSEGRGRTAAGAAPLQAADLRRNQIKQGAIATQSLTLKSAIYAAQGNLALAKDAADKAANAQYEEQQRAIDYQKALLDANAPQLNREEKAQAAIVQAQLQDRQNQIDQAKEDKKTIIALAVQAMQNNPNDQQAQYAAQQALAESNKQQPNLQTALNLIGKYQKDPNAVALQIAQIAEARANASKTSVETQQLLANGAGGTLASANLRTTTSGISYVDGTNLTGKDAAIAQRAAAKAGVAYLDKTTADLQNNVETARQNMKNIAASLDGLLATSGIDIGAKVGNAISSYTQIGGNADALASFNAYRSAAIQALRAMAGAKGLRINQAEIMQSVNQDIPKITDTVGVAKAKIAIVNSLLDSQEKGTFGSQYYRPAGDTGSTVMTSPDGKTQYNVPNDKVDIFKQNGYK